MKLNADDLFVNTYGTERIRMARGKKCTLWDDNGKQYLDFFGGIAVNALGYGNAALAKIIAKQYQELPHISNLYTTAPAVKLAHAILEHQPITNRIYSGLFFSNSGAEANEAALKFAAIYAQNGKNHTPSFAAFRNAFHGRTFLTLALTSQKKHRIMYEKMLPKVHILPYNDAGALHDGLTDDIDAVIVEVIQGEGGMRALNDKCALLLNRICNSKNIILIADEVQTGLGRTGTLYASEQVGLKPDIITIAKPLGGGLPLAATLVTDKIGKHITPAIHGSTFGGGPVQCALAYEVWNTIAKPPFLRSVQKAAAVLNEALLKLSSNHIIIRELRGFGLLRGIRLRQDIDIPMVIDQLRQAGLLVISSGENIIRLAPPLIITTAEISQAIKILDSILGKYERRRSADG